MRIKTPKTPVAAASASTADTNKENTAMTKNTTANVAALFTAIAQEETAMTQNTAATVPTLADFLNSLKAGTVDTAPAAAASVPTISGVRPTVDDLAALRNYITFGAKSDPLNLTNREAVSFGRAKSLRDNANIKISTHGDNTIIVDMPATFEKSDTNIDGRRHVAVTLTSKGRYLVQEEVKNPVTGVTFWRRHGIMDRNSRKNVLPLRRALIGGCAFVVNYNEHNKSHAGIPEAMKQFGGTPVQMKDKSIAFAFPQGIPAEVEAMLEASEADTAAFCSIDERNKYVFLFEMTMGTAQYATELNEAEFLDLLAAGMNSQAEQEYKAVKQVQSQTAREQRLTQQAQQPKRGNRRYSRPANSYYRSRRA